MASKKIDVRTPDGKTDGSVELPAEQVAPILLEGLLVLARDLEMHDLRVRHWSDLLLWGEVVIASRAL